jgi:hypothetical protein
MVEGFESFFNETGVDQNKFNQDVAKAKSFGLKFQETFKPEFTSSLEEMKLRSQRLNAQEPVVLGLPNSFTYYFIVVGLTFLAYNLISE